MSEIRLLIDKKYRFLKDYENYRLLYFQESIRCKIFPSYLEYVERIESSYKAAISAGWENLFWVIDHWCGHPPGTIEKYDIRDCTIKNCVDYPVFPPFFTLLDKQ